MDICRRNLLPEARLHGNALASFGAATGQHSPSALGFHSGAKTVHLGAAPAVRLKSALGHLTCGTPTQDCLRWANDKYKGTEAFRATLWHREDDNSAEARAAYGMVPATEWRDPEIPAQHLT